MCVVLLQDDLIYAGAIHPDVFHAWVVREGYFVAHPEAKASGRIPSDSTINRAIKKFREDG